MFVFWITVQYSFTWQKLNQRVSVVNSKLLYNMATTVKEQNEMQDRLSTSQHYTNDDMPLTQSVLLGNSGVR